MIKINLYNKSECYINPKLVSAMFPSEGGYDDLPDIMFHLEVGGSRFVLKDRAEFDMLLDEVPRYQLK